MGGNFASALLAGVVASVIWLSISLWLGMTTSSAGLWSLVFLIATTVLSLVISNSISSKKSAG